MTALASVLRRPIFPIDCTLSPSLNLHLPRSFSASSSHLNLGLPLFRLPSGLLLNTFLSALHWSILTACSIHSNLFFLIFATMLRFLYSSLNSRFVPVLYVPCSVTGPYILLNIFLSHIPGIFLSISVIVQVQSLN